jgi:TPR repeat protein
MKLSQVLPLLAAFAVLNTQPVLHAQFLQNNPNYYLDQAQAGDAEAQFQMGLQLVRPEDASPQELKQGFNWIRKAADQKHLRAMYTLGYLYGRGIGTESSDAKAVEWLEKAASENMPEAKLDLAVMLDQGKGAERNPERVIKLLQDAAKQSFPGQSNAQLFYGQLLSAGRGTKKNSAKAAIWYLKSAQQGNSGAQRRLAYLYASGDGVPLDFARCTAWYRRATQSQGADPWAKNDLAWLLATCPEEKYHDGRQAVTLAKEAIQEVNMSGEEQKAAMVDTMAAALARNGQFSEAIVWQKRCISLLAQEKEMPDVERTKLEAEFNSRLALYKQKQPYADPLPKPAEEPAEPLYNDDVLDESKQGNTMPPVRQAPAKPAPPAQQKSI